MKSNLVKTLGAAILAAAISTGTMAKGDDNFKGAEHNWNNSTINTYQQPVNQSEMTPKQCGEFNLAEILPPVALVKGLGCGLASMTSEAYNTPENSLGKNVLRIGIGAYGMNKMSGSGSSGSTCTPVYSPSSGNLIRGC